MTSLGLQFAKMALEPETREYRQVKQNVRNAVPGIFNFLKNAVAVVQKVGSFLNPTSGPLTAESIDQLNLLRSTINPSLVLAGMEPYDAEFVDKDDARVFYDLLKNMVTEVKSQATLDIPDVADKAGKIGKEGFNVLSVDADTTNNSVLLGAAYAAMVGRHALKNPVTGLANSDGNVYTDAKAARRKRAVRDFIGDWIGEERLSDHPNFSPHIVPWRQPINSASSILILASSGGASVTQTFSAGIESTADYSLGPDPYYGRDWDSEIECPTVTRNATNGFCVDTDIDFKGFVIPTANQGLMKPFFFNTIEGSLTSASAEDSFGADIKTFFTRTDQLEHYLIGDVSLDIRHGDNSTSNAGKVFAEKISVVVTMFGTLNGVTKIIGITGGEFGDETVANTIKYPTVNIKQPLRTVLNKQRSLAAAGTDTDLNVWGVAHFFITDTYTPAPAAEALVASLISNAHISSQSYRPLVTSELSNFNERTSKWSTVNTSSTLSDYIGNVSASDDGEPSSTLWAYVSRVPGAKHFNAAITQVLATYGNDPAKLCPYYVAATGSTPSAQDIKNLHFWFSSREENTVRTTAVATALRKDWEHLIDVKFPLASSMRYLVDSA